MQIPVQFSNVLLYLNSLRWLNTVAGDGTGLTSQLLSTPSLPTQLMKDCTTPTGSTPPTFYEQQGGIFYVPQESEQWKSCETGPLVFRPYPRRLECLTICRCYKKGSTFSSVISRPWVLVRPGLNSATSRSADRRLSNWANRAAAYEPSCCFPNLLKLPYSFWKDVNGLERTAKTETFHLTSKIPNNINRKKRNPPCY